MYQCCIFDLDGTIINTIKSLTHTINLTLKTFGYPPIDEAHTKKFVGNGYEKFVERAFLYSGGKELVDRENVLEQYNLNFLEQCQYQIMPYDGIPELLELLKTKGIKIGILTNKDHNRAVECVEKVYGKGVFDQILGEGNGLKLKPDPSGVYLIAKQLSVPISDCLYFGDTNTDMETGKNAGVDTVGVTWGFRTKEELCAYHPKYIISHPSEIREVFE
ncbi:HAD family hydrolase [Clostridium sp. E02]|uniref:HAD family hydrolase n=1 Tax=Clostridium sp. E02 TaxID=2487134 RepID=UPI000F53792A|nr:HAD family hydrolase [Clostridium sp. E02]